LETPFGARYSGITDMSKAPEIWMETAADNLEKMEESRPLKGRIMRLKDPGGWQWMPEGLVYNPATRSSMFA